MSYVLFRVVHICCAVVWFAAPLGLVKILKIGLAGGPESFQMSTTLSAKRGALAGVAGLLTLATGVAMIFSIGGFGAAPPQLHAAIGIAVIMLGISLGVLKPMGGQLSAIAEKGLDDEGRAQANAILKKMGGLSHGLHGLWLLLLVLMYWR